MLSGMTTATRTIQAILLISLFALFLLPFSVNAAVWNPTCILGFFGLPCPSAAQEAPRQNANQNSGSTCPWWMFGFCRPVATSVTVDESAGSGIGRNNTLGQHDVGQVTNSGDYVNYGEKGTSGLGRRNGLMPPVYDYSYGIGLDAGEEQAQLAKFNNAESNLNGLSQSGENISSLNDSNPNYTYNYTDNGVDYGNDAWSVQDYQQSYFNNSPIPNSPDSTDLPDFMNPDNGNLIYNGSTQQFSLIPALKNILRSQSQTANAISGMHIWGFGRHN